MSLACKLGQTRLRVAVPLLLTQERKQFQSKVCRMASNVPMDVLSPPDPKPVTPDTAPVAVVVGAGPGLGLAIAKRFAREGFQVALMSRDEAKLNKCAQEIVATTTGRAVAITCDSSNPSSVQESFQLAKSLGNIQVLVYNASGSFPWPPPKFTEIPLERLETSLKISCTGAFLCAQQVLDGMEERKSGSVIFTGATASAKGSAGFSTFACGKFALRALAQALAREYGPKGVHVAHVIVDGIIHTPRVREMRPGKDADTMLDPDAIAETYWHLHTQHRSAWTQELDLRPFSEKF